MAHGMAVVAATDPKVSYLIDQTSAKLVMLHSAEGWATAINQMLDTPAQADALAASALTHVRQHHRVYDQVRGVLDAYATLTGTLAKVGAASA